jgi:hypothetical protein
MVFITYVGHDTNVVFATYVAITQVLKASQFIVSPIAIFLSNTPFATIFMQPRIALLQVPEQLAKTSDLFVQPTSGD